MFETIVPKVFKLMPGRVKPAGGFFGLNSLSNSRRPGTYCKNGFQPV